MLFTKGLYIFMKVLCTNYWLRALQFMKHCYLLVGTWWGWVFQTVSVKSWQIESSFASQAISALMMGRSRWARLLRKKVYEYVSIFNYDFYVKLKQKYHKCIVILWFLFYRPSKIILQIQSCQLIQIVFSVNKRWECYIFMRHFWMKHMIFVPLTFSVFT